MVDTINTIKFSDMTLAGDMPNDSLVPGLFGASNVLFNNPWTFLASGSTATRPVPSASNYGRLRFNTDTSIYEYYDSITAMWTDLSGTGTGTVNPGVANQMAYYASNGTAVSPLTTANSSVLIASAGGVPSFSNTLPIGLNIPSAIITASTAALTAGSVIAAPIAGSDLVNKTYADGLYSSSVHSITGTTNQITASTPTGDVTLSLPQDIALGSTPTFAGLTLSSIPLGSSSGGTGVNNGSSIITLDGSLTTSGAFASTFTMTGLTNVTFPTTGTLLTSAGAVTSITGTANQVIASASTGAVTLSLPQSIGTTSGVTFGSLSFSSTSGIIGTILGTDAASGSVGEFVSSVIASGSAISISTATSTDVTSITLTAGDWDIWGNIVFYPETTTSITALFGWANTTSVLIPDGSLVNTLKYNPATVVGATFIGFSIPARRYNVASSITVYLSARATFSVTPTMTVFGGIYARRRR